MIIVDSDIFIDVFRQHPAALSWFKSLGDERIILPGFVAMELLQGCPNKLEQLKLKQYLDQYEIVWADINTCEDALNVFFDFNLSHGIGIIDTLIGQIAVSMNLPLYTFNSKHYAVIPKLELIQPYIK